MIKKWKAHGVIWTDDETHVPFEPCHSDASCCPGASQTDKQSRSFTTGKQRRSDLHNAHTHMHDYNVYEWKNYMS